MKTPYRQTGDSTLFWLDDYSEFCDVMMIAGYWMGVCAGGLNPGISESITLYDSCGLPFGRIRRLHGFSEKIDTLYAWQLELEQERYDDLKNKLKKKEVVTVRFDDKLVAIGN